MGKLKYKLYRLLFKDIININYEEILKYKKSEYAAEQKAIQLESDHTFFRQLIKHMFYKGFSLVAIKESKKEEVLLGMYLLDDDLTFTIFSKTYNINQNIKPLLFATKKMVPVKTIVIDDIQALDKRNGLGGIMLEYLINWAKENEIAIIKGDLTEKDKENWVDSVPFYKHFGFQVTFNKVKTEGTILLVLRKSAISVSDM